MSERGDKLMNRLSDWFGQEISGNTSKTAADIVRAQKDGVGAYSIGGIILSGCGIGWILLSFIPIICKNPLSDWGWMLILAAIHIVLGIVLVFLIEEIHFQSYYITTIVLDLLFLILPQIRGCENREFLGLISRLMDIRHRMHPFITSGV